MSGDDHGHYQPEEMLAIMEAPNGTLGRVASGFGRNLTVCVHKRQILRRAALARRQMSQIWLRDDGLPFAALMTRIYREHRTRSERWASDAMRTENNPKWPPK